LFQQARFLLKMHPIPIEIICYHCQQSVEKYLKVYIDLNGDKVIRTHDLKLLNKRCMNFDKEFQKIKDDF